MIYDQSMSQFISAREIWEFLAENIQEILEGGGFFEESCLWKYFLFFIRPIQNLAEDEQEKH